MELKRDDIVKALECCIKAQCWGDCEELGCPAHTKHGCYFYLRTEDDYENVIYIELCKSALSLINELTEENERLRAIPEQLHKEMSERMIEERKIERKLAVRKIQERLKSVAYQSGDWSHGEHPMVVELDDIDQIAEEIIGETNG